MNPAARNEDLGPLPQSDRNAELQRLSIKSLQALLRQDDDLLFRDERADDYGVDGSFELKVGGAFTNLRAQVQLKASESLGANADQSISFSVETYNLNYLLNGPCPVYILFDATKNEFWYVWAHDEAKRLLEENASWKDQKSITLRFRDRLDHAAIAQVRERILREGRLNRKITDSLARATLDDPVVLSISPENLHVTDGEAANRLLLASGPAIVGSGYAQEAIRLAGLLSPAAQSHPRLQLVVAYANFTLGNFHEARGQVGRALAQVGELHPHDVHFLHGLRDACDFRQGLIDASVYTARAKQRVVNAQSPLEASISRIEELRYQLMSERDRTARKQLQVALGATVEAVQRDSSASDGLKLNAHMALLYVEGTEAIMRAMHELNLAQMSRNLGRVLTPEMAATLSAANSDLKEWGSLADDAVQQAVKLRHPILIGDALTIRLSVRIFQLVNQRLQSVFERTAFDVPANVLQSLKADADHAVAVYRDSGSADSELRVKMLLADLYEAANDIANAKQLATEVCPIATALGYPDLAERAKELIENRTTLMEAEKVIRSIGQADQDAEMAQLDDMQMREYARDSAKAAGIPMSRLPVVERDVLALRSIAQERLAWCRHLELLQDLRHLDSPSTAYAADPNRKCVCELLGYETGIPAQDAATVIAAFKSAHCADCIHRSPKRP